MVKRRAQRPTKGKSREEREAEQVQLFGHQATVVPKEVEQEGSRKH